MIVLNKNLFIMDGVLSTMIANAGEAVPATSSGEVITDGATVQTGDAATTDTGSFTGDAAGMNGMDGMNAEVGTAKSITQSVPATIGVAAGVLVLSILAGIVIAKLKIKKGINLYED